MLVGDCVLPSTAARAGDFIFGCNQPMSADQPEFRGEI
jgi:hypothetical protein